MVSSLDADNDMMGSTEQRNWTHVHTTTSRSEAGVEASSFHDPSPSPSSPPEVEVAKSSPRRLCRWRDHRSSQLGP